MPTVKEQLKLTIHSNKRQNDKKNIRAYEKHQKGRKIQLIIEL